MSVIFRNAVVFLHWRGTWRAFLKQRRLLHSFLNLIWNTKSKDAVGKKQARAERIRKYTFSAKRRRHIKGAKTRDPSTQCADLREGASIRKASIAAGDSRIIGSSSRDLVVIASRL